MNNNLQDFDWSIRIDGLWKCHSVLQCCTYIIKSSCAQLVKTTQPAIEWVGCNMATHSGILKAHHFQGFSQRPVFLIHSVFCHNNMHSVICKFDRSFQIKQTLTLSFSHRSSNMHTHMDTNHYYHNQCTHIHGFKS